MTEREWVLHGGAGLRQYRTLAGSPTTLEVAKRTGGKVSKQQIGHLENGDRDRPSMRDLVLLGKVYGVTPNELAILFGYWQGPEEDAPEDSRITLAKHIANTLPEPYRDRLLRAIEIDAVNAKLDADRAAILDQAKQLAKEQE
jgi:transcriptional regulator with XRE-family HTH domain